MKAGIFTAALLISIPGGQAAFADERAPVPWQGVYAGASIGYATTDTVIEDPLGGPFSAFPIETDADDTVPAARLGYDFRRGHMVFGVVSDFTFTGIDGTAPGQPAGPPTAFDTEYEWVATLRGRIGVLVRENALVYGHGGLAYSEITNTEAGGAGPFAGASGSDKEFGYVIGAGIEVMTGTHLSIFAEYAFLDFDTPSSIGTVFGPLVIDNDPVHEVKLGVNIRF